MAQTIRELAIKQSLNTTKKIKTIADDCGCSVSTVYRWLKKYRQTGITTKSKSTGRPRKIDGKIRSFIGTKIHWYKAISTHQISAQIKERFNIDVDNTTVWRVLKDFGYNYKKPIPKPHLEPRHIAARKRWSLSNKSRRWNRVIFSDESTFQLYRNTVKYWTKSMPLIKKNKKTRNQN